MGFRSCRTSHCPLTSPHGPCWRSTSLSKALVSDPFPGGCRASHGGFQVGLPHWPCRFGPFASHPLLSSGVSLCTPFQGTVGEGSEECFCSTGWSLGVGKRQGHGAWVTSRSPVLQETGNRPLAYSSCPTSVPNPLPTPTLLDTFLNLSYIFAFLWWVCHIALRESIPHSFAGCIMVHIFTRLGSEWVRGISRGLNGPGVSVGRTWGHMVWVIHKSLWCSWNSPPSTRTK